MHRRLLVVAVAGTLLVPTLPALAGETLLELLNHPRIDQENPPEEDRIKEEGLGLCTRRPEAVSMIPFSSTRTVGQTITLGDDVSELSRISLAICHWPNEWTAGESVTFTLYDSPQKNEQYYTRTIPWPFKWHKWDIVFDTYTPAKPGQQFYLELSLHNEGDGDDRVRVVYTNNNTYPRGQLYVNGEPQPDKDLYFLALTRPRLDPDALMQGLLAQFDLEHPELAAARQAAEAGNYDQAAQEILAAF